MFRDSISWTSYIIMQVDLSICLSIYLSTRVSCKTKRFLHYHTPDMIMVKLLDKQAAMIQFFWLKKCNQGKLFCSISLSQPQFLCYHYFDSTAAPLSMEINVFVVFNTNPIRIFNICVVLTIIVEFKIYVIDHVYCFCANSIVLVK